jgi:hypothetical protein
MSFTTITGTGSVTMGTPSSVSNTSTNSVSSGTHTHALSGELVETTSGSPLYYGARAWVNFNGTGTVAIKANVNVSSITDNGAGDYTVNFTTSMPDENYAVAATTRYSATPVISISINSTIAPTTSAVRLNVTTGNGTFGDASIVCVTIFR